MSRWVLSSILGQDRMMMMTIEIEGLQSVLCAKNTVTRYLEHLLPKRKRIYDCDNQAVTLDLFNISVICIYIKVVLLLK